MAQILKFLPKLGQLIGRGGKGLLKAARGVSGTKAGQVITRGITKVRTKLSGRLPKWLINTTLWGAAGYGFDKFTEVGLESVFGDNVDQDGLNNALMGIMNDLINEQPQTMGAVYYICENNRLWDYLERGETVPVPPDPNPIPPPMPTPPVRPFEDDERRSVRTAPSDMMIYYSSLIEELLNQFKTSYRMCLNRKFNTALSRERATADLRRFLVSAVRLNSFIQLLMDECCVLSSEDVGEIFRVASLVTTKAALAERQIIDDLAATDVVRCISKYRTARERVDSAYLHALAAPSPFDTLIEDHFPLLGR